MASKVRYLIQRGGRYHARVVVPERLRAILKKVELSASLGADRRAALRKLPSVVALFHAQIAEAERRLDSTAKTSRETLAAFNPMGAARSLYEQSIAFDSELRDATALYARHGFPDEEYIQDLKLVIAGRLDEHEMPPNFLANIRPLVPAGLDHTEWRKATRLLARAELAALEVSALRDEGEADPPSPEFLAATERTSGPSETIRNVFDAYRTELQRIGKGRDAEARWAPIIDSLVSHVGHNSAIQITRRDAVKWVDHLLERLSPKTVRDSYLATARAAFSWAVDKIDLKVNPFAGVRVRLSKKVRTREKGFRLDEAQAILKASRNYMGSGKEHPKMTAAKQWVPLLGAYSGARVGELCQLRVEDVRRDSGIHYIRITPEAGTVKSGLYRDVPLHDHLIEEGFLDFVKKSGSGPLFYRSGPRRGKTTPAEIVAGRLGKWVRTLGVIPPELQPSHAWRHRLKTVGRELGADPRVLDAIQGHAARTAGDDYGDVTLPAKLLLIKKLPRYHVD